MTRLLDQLALRFTARGIEPSGASILTTTYGIPGNEPILPTLTAQTQAAYGSNAVVFGAILARLSLFSEATFAYQDLTDGHLFGDNEVDGRRATVLRKLENPWPGGTTGELLARMMQDIDLAGNAYVWDAGAQLVRLRPDWVTIVSELVDAESGESIRGGQPPSGTYYRRVLGYWYEPPPTELDKTRPMGLPVADVAHWSPIPDPVANFRGVSWLTPVLREVAGDNAMTAYKIKYMDNAASPNLLIRYDQELKPSAINTIRERIEARYGGLDNAFRTMVLDRGADVTVIGNTFEQMNFSTVQAAGENRIVIASGVPGIVIGSKEGLMAATYSNYEQAMRRFADITMRPLWRSGCASLSKLAPPPPRARLWFRTDSIAALRQGEKERADTILVKAQAAAELYGKFEPDSITSFIDTGDISQLEPMEPPPPPVGLPVLNGAPPLPVTPNGVPNE